MLYTNHPITDIFPSMTNGEYAAFLADIQEYGQREPIFVYQGQIVDGRNRYRACLELGISPTVREYDGDEASLTAFVISLNLHRRHLNESQRALVAMRLENMPLGGDRKSENQDANLHLEITRAVWGHSVLTETI